MKSDISNDTLRMFFDHFKSTCPIFLRHTFDKNRNCKKCGMNSMANWQLTTEGYEYYEKYAPILEKKEIQKKIMNILNKITNDNVEKLLDQFADIVIKDIHTESQLYEAVRLIFNKIINEPNYMKMYVMLCMKLSKVTIKGKLKNTQGSEKFRKCSFKKELLNIAMVEYYKKLNDAYAEELSTLGKKHMINIIHFISELYNYEVICSNIIHNFIQSVLYKDEYIDENWEALCKLFSIIGRKLDRQRYSGLVNKYFIKFTEVFNGSEHVGNSKHLRSNRIYYLMMNVIESRLNGWPC